MSSLSMWISSPHPTPFKGNTCIIILTICTNFEPWFVIFFVGTLREQNTTKKYNYLYRLLRLSDPFLECFKKLRFSTQRSWIHIPSFQFLIREIIANPLPLRELLAKRIRYLEISVGKSPKTLEVSSTMFYPPPSPHVCCLVMAKIRCLWVYLCNNFSPKKEKYKQLNPKTLLLPFIKENKKEMNAFYDFSNLEKNVRYQVKYLL